VGKGNGKALKTINAGKLNNSTNLIELWAVRLEMVYILFYQIPAIGCQVRITASSVRIREYAGIPIDNFILVSLF
jgi:ABC-type uncharacterized transport system permease subunit